MSQEDKTNHILVDLIDRAKRSQANDLLVNAMERGEYLGKKIRDVGMELSLDTDFNHKR